MAKKMRGDFRKIGIAILSAVILVCVVSLVLLNDSVKTAYAGEYLEYFYENFDVESPWDSAFSDWESGAKATIVDEEAEYEMFGKNPIFIYHKTDKSNRPIRGYHTGVLKRRAYLPIYIKEAFHRTFVDGLSDRENERTTALCFKCPLVTIEFKYLKRDFCFALDMYKTGVLK